MVKRVIFSFDKRALVKAEWNTAMFCWTNSGVVVVQQTDSPFTEALAYSQSTLPATTYVTA